MVWWMVSLMVSRSRGCAGSRYGIAMPTNKPEVWNCGDRCITLDVPRVMGILNVTPDSFSDGGEHLGVESATARGIEMVSEGADIIDIGGESTRPGAGTVSECEQIARVVPVIESLRRAGVRAAISVDTTRSAVARAALETGAEIVNDQSAGLDDAAMLPMVAEAGAGVVLMHRYGPAFGERYSTAISASGDKYEGNPLEAIAAVAEHLRAALGRAERAGVDRRAVLLDPGLGFGKSVAVNYGLLAASGGVLGGVGRPILCGASRKSFVGAATGVAEPSERDAGSIGVAVAALVAGARVFRVHAVRGHREALDAAEWVVQAAREPKE